MTSTSTPRATSSWLEPSDAVLWAAYADGTATAPSNNDFASSSPLSGPFGTMYDSSIAATKQTGEPNHAGRVGGSSIWYTWIGTGSGPVTISTSGSSFDTVLGVYEGNAVNALTLVASNDDISSTDRASRVTFNAVPFRTYRIAVDGYAAASGAVTLSWDMAPANNTFATATTLTGSSGGVIDANYLATFQTGEPIPPDPSPTRRTLWYKWTAPAAGTLKIDTSGVLESIRSPPSTPAQASELSLPAAPRPRARTL